MSQYTTEMTDRPISIPMRLATNLGRILVSLVIPVITAIVLIVGFRFLRDSDAPKFVIVAVEKTEPYGVNAFHISGAALEYGYGTVFSSLYTIGDCREKDEWPGYGHGLHTVSIPAWVR